MRILATRSLASMTSIALSLTIVSSVLSASVDASADDYPSRPIRIVVGFTAGGPTDIPIRSLPIGLARQSDSQLLWRINPGLDRCWPLWMFFRVLATAIPFWPAPILIRSIRYSIKKAQYKVSDLAPVSLISKYDYAIAVSKTVPVKNMRELTEYARLNADKLNYGHLGIGSSQNLVGKRLEKVAGMKMTGVPYKGAADALQEVVSGRLDLFVGPPFVVMPLYEAG